MLVAFTYAIVTLGVSWLVVRAAWGLAGPNPVTELLHDLGVLGALALLSSLAIRPLVQLSGWRQLFPLRKALGLQAFLLSFLHLGIYVGLELRGDAALLWEDFWQRPHIRWGILAFLCLVPLALTSSFSWQRRLGKRAWHGLHRLVFPAALLTAVHALLAPKTWELQTLVGCLLLLGLLLLRWRPLMQRLRRGRTASPD